MVDQKIKSRAIHRAKIIKGQMEGLTKAIDDEKYCPDLLQLSFSIQRSLKSLDALLLENHLKTHVKHQMMQRGQDQKAIRELVDVYTLSNK
ncbi:MAG: metal-sensing transcriptional repressor [bacterium]|nr:metal-sensing transcriptional repressor [bacterium]